jgi:hypothetical protein
VIESASIVQYIQNGPREMWFSAEADLVTGIVVGAFGIDARCQVGARRQVPLAATPVLLAIHEGRRRLCGRSPCRHVALHIEHAAIYLLVAVAFVLPFSAPYAMLGRPRCIDDSV